MSVNFNILITSISDKIPLLDIIMETIKNNQYNINVFIADSNQNCVASYYHKDFWKMPRDESLDKLSIIDFCKKNNIKLIIPTRDGELFFWSKLKDELNNLGITVLISSINSVKICYDKLLFSTIEISNNAVVIPTFRELDRVTSDRVVVKERFGSGSSYIGLNLNKQDAIELAKTMKNPVFQPYKDGKEYSVDIYCDLKGGYIGSISRERVLVKNGESKVTTTFYDEQIDHICKNFTLKNKFCGPLVLQYIKNNNNYYIIECNTRFGGASTLSIKAGLDVFNWVIQELEGARDKIIFNKKSKQMTQIRVSKDFYL